VSHGFGAGLVPLPTAAPAGPYATGTTAFTSSTHIYEQIARFGMNYNFTATPVVAE
jgi:hypothetical protein